MRIAVIGKKYPFCGIVTYCRELRQALEARGHEVAFYYMHNEEEEALPYLFKTHMFTVPALDARAKLAQGLAEFKPDVVHASFALGPLDWSIPEICAELGVPLVATFHVALDHRPTFPNQVSAWVYRLYASTLARCDRVVIFSEHQRDKLDGLGVPRENVVVLPNGVDVQRYRPGPSRFRASLGDGPLMTEGNSLRLIGYMGRLDPEKNVGSLLEAFANTPLPVGTQLAIMGDGVLASRLRKKYAEVQNVHWLGFVEDEAERIDVLRGCDLFVLPSSVEGLSLALLEAMACGAVPVATDVGADGEVIEGVGKVIDPTKLDTELGPAIAELLAHPHHLQRLRGATRKRVVERYAFHQNVNALLEVYAGAIQGLERQSRGA